MKAWLKGGLITSLVFLVVGIINYSFVKCAPWGFGVFSKIIYPSIWHEMFLNTGGCERGIIILYSAILWFIIGAIIGLIIGGIKSRNQISNGKK